MTAEPKTVADLITSRAREHADKPFLLFGSGRITYGELSRRLNAGEQTSMAISYMGFASRRTQALDQVQSRP